MKHYAVINHWATNDDSGLRIVGVAHDIVEAQAMFNDAVVEEKEFANQSGWHIEEDTDICFEAYEVGYYSQAHTALYIEEVI